MKPCKLFGIAILCIMGSASAADEPTLEDIYSLCIASLKEPDQTKNTVETLSVEFQTLKSPGYWKAKVIADVGLLAINSQPGSCIVEGWTQNGNFWETNVEWNAVRDRNFAFFNDTAARGTMTNAMSASKGFAAEYCQFGQLSYRMAHSARSNRGPNPPLNFSVLILPTRDACSQLPS